MPVAAAAAKANAATAAEELRPSLSGRPPALPAAPPRWHGPAGLEDAQLLPNADASDGLLVPRYRWLEPDDASAVLEVLEPLHAGDELSVYVSECTARLSWGTWALSLPLPCRADAEACQVQRKRRRRLVTLMLPLSLPAPAAPPAQTFAGSLAAALSGAEGYALVDGFLRGAQADALRSRLLQLWRGGCMTPGEVEGSQDESNPNRARSDEYMYAEESETEMMSFARSLDRVVVELVRRVPALRDFKLLRGRPMAAVYAGAGSRYTPHFDCVGGDNGRVITCILYLNPFWRPEDGAVLRLWPQASTLVPSGPCREIEPLHGRLVVFLCNSRNLHEVSRVVDTGAGGRPAEPRLALSCWYYDEKAIPSIAEGQGTQDAPG